MSAARALRSGVPSAAVRTRPETVHSGFVSLPRQRLRVGASTVASDALELRTKIGQDNDTSGQAYGRYSGPEPGILTQARDVLGWRISEESAVLAAELRCAEIANSLACAARVHHRR